MVLELLAYEYTDRKYVRTVKNELLDSLYELNRRAKKFKSKEEIEATSRIMKLAKKLYEDLRKAYPDLYKIDAKAFEELSIKEQDKINKSYWRMRKRRGIK